MFVIHYLESSLDFSTTQPRQSKHVNNKTSFTGSYTPGTQPALEGGKAGGRWRLCLLFSDNRYLVFYVTLLYHSLKRGRAARLHLPICSPRQLDPQPRCGNATQTDGSPTQTGAPQPCLGIGGHCGKPCKTDLNVMQPLAGRGVLGDGMALKRGKSPQILPQGLGKTLSDHGRVEHKLGGSGKDVSCIGTKGGNTQPRQEPTGAHALL